MKPKHIKKAADLVTKKESTRAGFLGQAVAKGKHANLHILRAREFEAALSRVKTMEHLLRDLPDFKAELIAAAGFSEKSAKRIPMEDLEILIASALKSVLTERDFRKELVYRYLLTKGDALGGSMRNKIGSSAGANIVAEILVALKLKGITPDIVKTETGKVRSMSWDNRTLLFDYKLPLTGNNIDLILVDTASVTPAALSDPSRYLACGELKGGIDPAGADEHWKTANTALTRVRDRFANEKRKPKLFFVGAAIEGKMANEIFAQLQDGRLFHAANLTDLPQTQDLSNWLVSL